MQNCEFEINYNKINDLCAIFAKTFKVGGAFYNTTKINGLGGIFRKTPENEGAYMVCFKFIC